MVIREQRHGAVTVLYPEGPIVGEDATAFKLAAEEAAKKTLGRFVVDLTGTPFLDSEGLVALLEISETLSQSGHALRLCAACETVRTILELTGMTEHFNSFADANSAVRSFL